MHDPQHLDTSACIRVTHKTEEMRSGRGSSTNSEKGHANRFSLQQTFGFLKPERRQRTENWRSVEQCRTARPTTSPSRPEAAHFRPPGHPTRIRMSAKKNVGQQCDMSRLGVPPAALLQRLQIKSRTNPMLANHGSPGR